MATKTGSFFDKFKYEGPDQENGIIYNSVKVLGWGKTILLGLQHDVAMSGATILVPILVSGYFITIGSKIQTALFFAGLATLLFQLCTYAKVPVFLGSSFAFLGGYASIAQLDAGKYAAMSMDEKFQYASGGVVIAGLLYFVLALLVKRLGTERVMKYLPPAVTGPIIVCIGLSLAPSAIDNFDKNPLLAVISVVIVVAFYVYGKGIFKIIPILMGFVLSYLVALIMQAVGMTNVDGSAIIDFSSIYGTPLIGAPPIVKPLFDFNIAVMMVACAIPAMVEHVGDINAISETAKRNYLKYPGLHRTLCGDGGGTSLAGLFGGFPNTTYGENTGVMAITKNADPRGMRIAAYGAIILGCCPLAAVILGTIPTAVIGGVSFLLYGMIAGIGFRNLIENRVDLMNERNLMTVSIILPIGVAVSYKHPSGITLFTTSSGTPIALSGLAMASLLGILVNALLNVWLPGGAKKNKYEYGANPKGDANRGIAINANIEDDLK